MEKQALILWGYVDTIIHVEGEPVWKITNLFHVSMVIRKSCQKYPKQSQGFTYKLFNLYLQRNKELQ